MSKLTRVSEYSEGVGKVAVGSFFNGLDINSDVDFKLYQHKKDFVIHGEDQVLDYDGVTNGEDPMKYCVGVFDPAHKSIQLFDDLPLLISKITSKKRKLLQGPRVRQTGIKNNVKRNLLGETFGTKKAKKLISDLEKNRIDSETLESNEIDIIDSLSKSTKLLPTREELNETVVAERPIPAFNADAKNVDDIYPLDNVIPARLFQFIRVDSMLKQEPLVVLEQLPYTNNFVTTKVMNLNKDLTNDKKQKYQMVYYLSLLLGVYNNRRCNNKLKLSELLKEPSDFLIDNILENFTISKTGNFGRAKDRSFVIDPHNEDKLLSYILVLILRLNNYLIEIPPLSSDLSLKPSKLINLLKNIGCQIKTATQVQLEIFGINKAQLSTYKIASLKVPFKIPEVSSGRRR